MALTWFFTTSNRFIRDKATKALVGLLNNKLAIIKEVMIEFQKVNDPYVLERLCAVAYGCMLRDKKNDDGAKVLVNGSMTIFSKNQSHHSIFSHAIMLQVL